MSTSKGVALPSRQLFLHLMGKTKGGGDLSIHMFEV